MVIKLSERESFIKSFLLFFGTFELFLIFLFFHYHHETIDNLYKNLELKMKNYSFTLKGEMFDIDITNKSNHKYYELNRDKLILYTPLNDKNDLIIKAKRDNLQKEIYTINKNLILNFILLTLVGIIISSLFAIYSLKPLKESAIMLDTFIKDIVHDLNTPITSILINLKLLNIKNEEIDNIEYSAKTISMLHANLNNYLYERDLNLKDTNITEVVKENIEFFKFIYKDLKWIINLDDVTIVSDKNLFFRIVNNLISNACKYNIPNGYIKIELNKKYLIIENSSYKDIDSIKVFNRFYKESDRGLGIGLNIVKKLSKKLGLKINLSSKNHIVSAKLTFK